jgi:hypothetical protein
VYSTVGLSLMIIGWAEQIFRSLIKRHLSFSPFFLTFYLVGAAALAYDNIRNNNEVLWGALFAVTVVLAFAMLVILIYRKVRPGAF